MRRLVAALLSLAVVGSAHAEPPREPSVSTVSSAAAMAGVFYLVDAHGKRAGLLDLFAQDGAQVVGTEGYHSDGWVHALAQVPAAGGWSTHLGAASAVSIDPDTGATISFSFPGLGDLALRLEPRSGDPQPTGGICFDIRSSESIGSARWGFGAQFTRVRKATGEGTLGKYRVSAKDPSDPTTPSLVLLGAQTVGRMWRDAPGDCIG